MTPDEIRLVIPAEEDFWPIAHLVTGGLATRLDLTFDDLEDLQVAVETVLALREDGAEVQVVLSTSDGVLRAELGPFPADAVHPDEPDGSLGLERVLETVCDSHEVDLRDDGAWIELTKHPANAAGAAG